MSFAVVGLYQFPISDPFKEGHRLTKIEANVLNWHRARLIQKIISRWITDALEDNGDDILSQADLERLRSRVTDFDRAYSLQPAKEPKESILEFNLEMLAKDFLYTQGQIALRDEDVERIKQTPEIQERARDLIRSSTFTLAELTME